MKDAWVLHLSLEACIAHLGESVVRRAFHTSVYL